MSSITTPMPDGTKIETQELTGGSIAEGVAINVGGSTPAFVGPGVPMPVSDPALSDILAKIIAAPATAAGQASAQSTLDALLVKVIAAPATAAAQAAILAAIQAGAPLAASELHIGQVTGSVGSTTATVARPADTAQYAALDVVANSVGSPAVLTFANAARVAGGSAYIVKGVATTDQSTCIARFRLHLFHTAPTAMADNAPYTDLWANFPNYVGCLDFPAMATEGAGSTGAKSINGNARLLFTCATGSTTLYGIVETLDPFAPASAQNIRFDLMMDNA